MLDLTFALNEGRNALVVPRIVNIGKRRIGRRDRQTLMMIAVFESSESSLASSCDVVVVHKEGMNRTISDFVYVCHGKPHGVSQKTYSSSKIGSNVSYFPVCFA